MLHSFATLGVKPNVGGLEKVEEGSPNVMVTIGLPSLRDIVRYRELLGL